MKNGEKYKTAEERVKAFGKWCHSTSRSDCYKFENCETCAFSWLDMEAGEEKSMPCPFCGNINSLHVVVDCQNHAQIRCTCGYHGAWYDDNETAIEEHNRVARAVMEADKKGDK